MNAALPLHGPSCALDTASEPDAIAPPTTPAEALPDASADLFEPAPSTSSPTGAIARLELLLRDPTRFLDDLEGTLAEPDHDAAMTSLLRVLVGAVAFGAGVFGAVVGAHRGGLQMLYCTVKIPLLLMLTLVVCAAPFIAFARAARLPLGARAIVALALASCARFALVLLGLAPFVWLMEGWSLGYHRVILAVVAVCLAAGIAAGRLLFSGLARHGAAGLRVGLAFVAVFSLVGAQASWILRPYVLRPRTTTVPFVRSLEGDFLDALGTTVRSSFGVYTEAPRPPAPRARCEGPSCD